MFKKESKIKAIKSVREFQKDNLVDDYNIGMYNGIELVLSILEEREPEYECKVNNIVAYRGFDQCDEMEGMRTISGNKSRSVRNE